MKAWIVVALCSLLTAVACTAAGYALYARFQQGKSVSLAYCKEIEKLKTAQRERAIDSYKRLDANLRLLHIEKTPEVVAAAKASRDRDLARFAADPCPRR